MVRPFSTALAERAHGDRLARSGAGCRVRDDADAHAQHDGVTLDAYSRNGQITFCFNAEKDIKIASEYGVEFTVPQGESKLWNERLPKVVAGSEPYFDCRCALI